MKNKQLLSNSAGTSLIELLIAMMLFSILVGSIILGFTNIARNEQNVRLKGQAINLAREGAEAVYTLAEDDWDVIGNASPTVDYQVDSSSGIWQLVQNSYSFGQYSRRIRITNAVRNSSDNLDPDNTVNNPGDYEDPETKFISVTVSWDSFGKTYTYTTTTIISQWKVFS
ncbi:hypothetical protein KC573_04395 [candidate division WWE3 bacterium]|uniref:Uncharacterized protein n=2 Tax=candidate division WWE3 bacterium TaxID=2053526 RepID=A0A955LWI4_UNCKA|nr:hypothetical protein [candidate division WWE3 bacterium]